jgi:integrase
MTVALRIHPAARFVSARPKTCPMRGFTEDTRRDYIRSVKALAAFIGRSPDTATAEDLRRLQLHQTQAGVRPPTINSSVSALRFFFTVAIDRPDLSRRLPLIHQPRKLPLVLSVEEVAQLLEAAPGPKYKAALGTAYGAGLRVSEIVALQGTDIDSTLADPRRAEQRAQGSLRHAVAATARVAACLVAQGQAPRRDAGLAVSGPRSDHATLLAADEPRPPCRRASRQDQQAGDAAYAAPQLPPICWSRTSTSASSRSCSAIVSHVEAKKSTRR